MNERAKGMLLVSRLLGVSAVAFSAGGSLQEPEQENPAGIWLQTYRKEDLTVYHEIVARVKQGSRWVDAPTPVDARFLKLLQFIWRGLPHEDPTTVAQAYGKDVIVFRIIQEDTGPAVQALANLVIPSSNSVGFDIEARWKHVGPETAARILQHGILEAVLKAQLGNSPVTVP